SGPLGSWPSTTRRTPRRSTASRASTRCSSATWSISIPRRRGRRADPRAGPGNLTTRQISLGRDTVTLVAEPDAAGGDTDASDVEIPMIGSRDEHARQPPHLWQTWLPARFRETGPRSERRGIGSMRHVGGGSYEQ